MDYRLEKNCNNLQEEYEQSGPGYYKEKLIFETNKNVSKNEQIRRRLSIYYNRWN